MSLYLKLKLNNMDGSPYFSHDYNARMDPKIKRMIAKFGMTGYGVYWAIIEDLYNNANALPTDTETIAFDLRCSEEVAKGVIFDFNLFEIHEDFFSSKSVQKRLDRRSEKSAKASESASYRWKKFRENANAVLSQSDSNAIKENKSKLNKRKYIKEEINKEEKNWKNDFEIFTQEIWIEFDKIVRDTEWIKEQERLNPGTDILLTIEKSIKNYWATVAGWKNKKKGGAEKPNWKQTFAKTMGINKVPKRYGKTSFDGRDIPTDYPDQLKF